MTINYLVADSLLLVGAVLAGLVWSRGLVRAPQRVMGRAGAGFLEAGLVTLIGALLAYPQGTAGPAQTLIAGTLVLVIFGAVLKFSVRYMEGFRQLTTFAGATILLGLALTVLALAQSLPLLVAGWLVSTQALIRLLRLAPSAAAAKAAARALWPADLAMLVAGIGLWVGSAQLVPPAINALVTPNSLATTDGLASQPLVLFTVGVALLVAVVLRSALVPFHGWLIRAMAAPAPVSAMLHAGFINGGGLLCLKFWPVLSATPGVLWMLALAATFSVVAASGLMRRRVDIKGHLSGSTIMQMSFMLLQFALGAPVHALLHLLAHAFYKAYAMLLTGTAVRPLGESRGAAAKRAGRLELAALALAASALVMGAAPADVLLLSSLVLMLIEGLRVAAAQRQSRLVRAVLGQGLLAALVVWGVGAALEPMVFAAEKTAGLPTLAAQLFCLAALAGLVGGQVWVGLWAHRGLHRIAFPPALAPQGKRAHLLQTRWSQQRS